MKNSPSRGQTLGAFEFEVVAVAPIPAHDRDDLSSVVVRSLPDFIGYPLGRKVHIVRDRRAFADTVREEYV